MSGCACWSKCFHHGLHELFSLRVGLWPERCDPLVFDSTHLHEDSKLKAGEWRPIITYLRRILGRPCVAKIRDNLLNCSFCCCWLDCVHFWKSWASIVTSRYSPEGSEKGHKSLLEQCARAQVVMVTFVMGPDAGLVHLLDKQDNHLFNFIINSWKPNLFPKELFCFHYILVILVSNVDCLCLELGW